jgi:hypothetical protein
MSRFELTILCSDGDRAQDIFISLEILGKQFTNNNENSS